MPFLKLENIGKIYVSNTNVAVGIRGINLSFELGEFVAITGKSGSGKSTLLNVISGMDTYEEGNMYIEGKETSYFIQEDYERYRQEYISFIFQDYNIIDSFTVLENVELALMHIQDKKERRKKALELIKREDKNSYHVRRLFKYKNYNVEYEFESSGIKQLVTLFTYLLICANGGIVFIDEMDTNLNSAYFAAIISFFAQYGKGQLIFTTHNLEAMNSLKSHSKSILVLGENNSIDVWVGKGNRSPIKDYLNGNLPNSPMNIEDFDFVNIFFGDEQAWFE